MSRVSPLRSVVAGPAIAKQVTYAGNPYVTGVGGVVATAGLATSTLHGHPAIVGSGLR